jgi:hypothetical protein
VTAPVSPVVSPAVAKLLRMLGPERGNAVVQETMKQLGLEAVKTPNECLRFGEALIKRGGLLEALGRSIKIQALLNGANEAA